MFFKRYEIPSVFLLGGFVYMGLEVLWRGFSHWSMGVCGGFCFLFIYLFEYANSERSIFYKCLFASTFITAAEFITGYLVNIVFDLRVWDYSDRFLNLLGQICPMFSVLWFFISIPAFFIARFIRNNVFSVQYDNSSKKHIKAPSVTEDA